MRKKKTVNYIFIRNPYEGNKWPKIAKGHYSNIISLNSLKIKSSDLLLSPNQYTKYQGSSSNTFLRYLANEISIYFITRGISKMGDNSDIFQSVYQISKL